MPNSHLTHVFPLFVLCAGLFLSMIYKCIVKFFCYKGLKISIFEMTKCHSLNQSKQAILHWQCATGCFEKTVNVCFGKCNFMQVGQKLSRPLTHSKTSHMCLQYNSFENTAGKGEIARKSNFSFSHSVFYPFGKLSAIS